MQGLLTTSQHSIRGNQYVKNYEFQFNFGAPWGNCGVVMTSVIGHLNGLAFEARYSNWQSCRPDVLFEARVHDAVDKASSSRLVAGHELTEGLG